MLPDFNVFSLLAWLWSEPSKAAQHSQAQCGLCLPAQVPIGQLPSMYRWHQRPPRALVPRSTRCNLHACPGIQGTRNLAKTLLRPLNVKLPLEKMLGDPSCLEVRWLVKVKSPHGNHWLIQKLVLKKNISENIHQLCGLPCCRWWMVTASCVWRSGLTYPLMASKISSLKSKQQSHFSRTPKPLHPTGTLLVWRTVPQQGQLFVVSVGLWGAAVPEWCPAVCRSDLAARVTEERLRAVPWHSWQCLCLPGTVQPHSEHEIPLQGLQGKSVCEAAEGLIYSCLLHRCLCLWYLISSGADLQLGLTSCTRVFLQQCCHCLTACTEGISLRSFALQGVMWGKW